ncbi:MAG TPA: helix-turn-helix transcriptional regulator [Haliangiales bacterium]|nr:helix-turn-helix transcriptional regulator [Haliangiales bacterium]
MTGEPTPLEPGRFYGVNRSELHVHGLILSDTHYRPQQHVPPHIHQRAYFGFLLGGGYWEQLGRRSASFEPLSLVFHPPREVRRGDISNRGARLFHVELPDSWMDRLREMGAVPDETLDHHGGPVCALARTLYREFHHPDAASPLVIEGVVLEMLGALLRRPPPADAAPPWLARARDRLAAQAIDPPSLVAVAADVGVAPVRLARTFRRAYGESPGDFVRRERIRRACDLLADPEASLAQVAADLGFSDQSHFTRVFRRLVGITPGAWRRARK